MPLRFETDCNDPSADLDPLIDEVFGELTSNFLHMPKGEGFIDYPTFERGYQALKKHTDAFSALDADSIILAVREAPISFVVFRCILGLTPPEWAHITAETVGVEVGQGAARSMDRKFRLKPLNQFFEGGGATGRRIRAMIEAGVKTIIDGADTSLPEDIHRLDKIDTTHGQESLQSVSDLNVPYPVLLYERFLGRPFASHKDSVSGLVGAVIEAVIRNTLDAAKVSFRETARAERVPGFDQAPDFIIPDELTPVAVIEAKLSEDDGTARDKITRVKNLRTLRDEQGKDYDVIAFIEGRGFKVRREDMRRLLQATDGKVFTPATADFLIENTRIREYRVR